MAASSALASSRVGIRVLPLAVLSGPRPRAGLCGTTWPTTSQSNSMRTAVRCCLTVGALCAWPCSSTQAATCTGRIAGRPRPSSRTRCCWRNGWAGWPADGKWNGDPALARLRGGADTQLCRSSASRLRTWMAASSSRSTSRTPPLTPQAWRAATAPDPGPRLGARFLTQPGHTPPKAGDNGHAGGGPSTLHSFTISGTDKRTCEKVYNFTCKQFHFLPRRAAPARPP